jgi:cytochrome P450
MEITTEPSANVLLTPPPPQDFYFSAEQQAWILSRHRDVLAALRCTSLSQTGPPKTTTDSTSRQDREKSQSEFVTALPSFSTSKWQLAISRSASALLRRLTRYCPVDLVQDFIQPWCLASAVALTGVDPVRRGHLAELVSCLRQSDAAPDNVNLKFRAREANKELDCIFVRPNASHAKSIFLGIAQTVPYFLASAWTALLQHPSEWRKLQKHPSWILRATEELLRYAGPVHTLFRQANKDMEIFGTKIECGDRLCLRLRSANRDPQQFPDPDRLDVTREVAGHLALSSGAHYCAGASLVRMMTCIGTQAILRRYLQPQLANPIEWSSGTMLVWPSSLSVRLGDRPEHFRVNRT